MRKTVIFDVDGTLCDVREIRHHVDPSHPKFSGTRNFHRFHAQSEWAPVNRWVARLLSDLADSGFRIVIVTAREARWAPLTERWLRERGVEFDAIFYRPNNDGRKDVVVKTGFLKTLRRTDSIVLAVDDSADVIAMWRQNSIPVLVVGLDGEAIKVDAESVGSNAKLVKVLTKHNLIG